MKVSSHKTNDFILKNIKYESPKIALKISALPSQTASFSGPSNIFLHDDQLGDVSEREKNMDGEGDA